MMKKIICTLALIALVVAVLCGCSENTVSPMTEANDSVEATPYISLIHTGDDIVTSEAVEESTGEPVQKLAEDESVTDEYSGDSESGIDFEADNADAAYTVSESDSSGPMFDVMEEVSFTVADADGVMYSVTELNVRTGPGTDYEKIGSLSYGDSVEVTGVADNGWVRINWDGMNAYASGSYLSEEEPATNNLTSSSGYSSGVISAENGVSLDMFTAVASYYNMIPSNVRSSFEDNGWSVLIVSGNLGSRFGYSFSIRGLTVYDSKMIYVDNREVAKNNILHEIGHYIDYVSGWVSDSQEFSDIRSREVGAFTSFWSTSSNNVSTTSEYFAEACEVILLDSVAMMAKCPETYEFIMSCANAL